MTKTRRAYALTALFLAFVLLLSVMALVGEADHDCVGEDCSVCAVAALCKGVLRIACAIALLACIAAGSFAAPMIACAVRNVVPTTPVTKKVKLSD